MKRIIYTLLILAGWVVSTQAQDLKEILTKVNKAYKNASGVSMDFSYTQGSVSDASDRETDLGRLAMKGQNLYYRFGQLEYISNATFTLMIDHEDKYLALDSTYRSLNTGSQLFEALTSDSIQNMLGGGTLTKMSSGNWKLTEYTDGLIHHSEIIIDGTTYLIKKMLVYYRTQAGGGATEFLQMSYSNFGVGNVSNTVFSIGKFYTKDHTNQWVKTARYSTYEEMYKP